MEINPSKTLKISPSLSVEQEEQLFTMLRKHIDTFAWDYKEMKGVHPSVYTHHMYIKEGCKLVRQP